MSIWSVRCYYHRFCRQAYVLAHRRGTVPLEQSLAPFINVFSRPAHSSLFQMVKKRTLEARTKLQSKHYPNPCMTIPQSTDLIPQEDDELASPLTTTAKQSSFLRGSSSSFQDPYSQVRLGDSRSYSNAQDVLKSSQCDKNIPKDDPCAEFMRLKRQAQEKMSCPPPCPPCGGGKGKGGGGDEYDRIECLKKKSEEKLKKLKMMMIGGMLAALLAGGLISWLIGRNKKDPMKEAAEKNMKLAKMSGIISSPSDSSLLPKHAPYLIVGGGTAAFSAFRAIKSNDAKAKVLMISNEFRKPYMRPPLSKELWYTPNANDDPIKDYRFKQWTGSERSLYFEPEEFFVDPEKLTESENGGIAVAQGFTVKKVDAQKKIVTLDDGYQIGYDQCLIATGCTPKNLSVFRDAPPSVREKVMVYRTPEDFDRLRRYAREKRSITIVGNGFVGSELACSLAHYAKQNKGGQVYQVYQEKANMSKVLPEYLSHWTTQKMEKQGVCVIPEASIKSVSRDDSQLKLDLNNGMTLLSDIVVVCVGCTPNTALAGVSKLEVDRSLGGFLVNAELEARSNLFAAGDASCFYDPLLGRRRVEHHDHSVVSGRLAGENMTGAHKPYAHQSMFWSDLGPEIGYEGIGMVDSSLPTVGVFALPSTDPKRSDSYAEVNADSKEEKEIKIKKTGGGEREECKIEDSANYGKGVIFYLKNDKIVGILLWNLFNRIGLARTIINQNADYADLNEVAKLFEIHA